MINAEKYRAHMRHPGYNGKDSPPPAPDYTAAANATAQGNMDAVRAQTAANRVNQFTPYGSLTYSQTPVFDQAGYAAALQAYNNQARDPAFPDRIGLSAPSIADFTDRDSGWTATQTLSPDQQKILEQNTNLTQGLLGTAQTGLGKVDELLSNPTIDESKLAQMPISGQSVQDAIFSRLQPQIERNRGSLESQLANQGITRGSEAWNNAQTDQGQQENDLMTQAALQGINTGLTARQQGIQEQTYMQDRPLNVVNALRTGNQVQGPQFSQVPQQAFSPGPDLLGAVGQQYGAQVGTTNANNANAAGTAQGVAAVAGTALAVF